MSLGEGEKGPDSGVKTTGDEDEQRQTTAAQGWQVSFR